MSVESAITLEGSQHKYPAFPRMDGNWVQYLFYQLAVAADNVSDRAPVRCDICERAQFQCVTSFTYLECSIKTSHWTSPKHKRVYAVHQPSDIPHCDDQECFRTSYISKYNMK